jgi:hypothetical protein
MINAKEAKRLRKIARVGAGDSPRAQQIIGPEGIHWKQAWVRVDKLDEYGAVPLAGEPQHELRDFGTEKDVDCILCKVPIPWRVIINNPNTFRGIYRGLKRLAA